jgi:hypothetical protein
MLKKSLAWRIRLLHAVSLSTAFSSSAFAEADSKLWPVLNVDIGVDNAEDSYFILCLMPWVS